MSGGRVELGIGTGWFAQEHAAYGIEFPPLGERFERLSEQLEIITGLWTTPPGETYSFSGAHYQLTDSPALPKPVQRPRPPVLIGGGGEVRTPQLAARFADEFNMPFNSLEATSTQFERVREACELAGRGRDSIVLSAAQVLCVGEVKPTSSVEPLGSAARSPNYERTVWPARSMRSSRRSNRSPRWARDGCTSRSWTCPTWTTCDWWPNGSNCG